jgi:hypothetical protein
MEVECYIREKENEILNKMNSLKDKEEILSFQKKYFLEMSRSAQELNKLGFELLVSDRNGRIFFTTENDSFYSLIRGYEVREAYTSRGKGIYEFINNEEDCFFEWCVGGGTIGLVGEKDLDFMQVYYEKNWTEINQREYWDREFAYKKVTHGKSIPEIVEYFSAKGVPVEVLNNLEKELLIIRGKNPEKNKWREL